MSGNSSGFKRARPERRSATSFRRRSSMLPTDSHMLARYLPPAAPTLRSAPLRGEQWLHEVKFDGWRIHLHKHGRSAAAFTTTIQVASVGWSTPLRAWPACGSLIIDGELVACDGDGVPDFYRLHFYRHDHGLCVWAFDLLHHNGRDLCDLPLIERKARLEKFIIAAKNPWLHYFRKLRRWPRVVEGRRSHQT
jgi:bifunctional non-homologous end joining protein LigD